MTNYRRLISYIYAYEGETKGKNIGFAKLESRNGQCKLSVNVKKVYVGSSDLGVYLLAPGKEIPLGNIFIRGGSGEFRAAVSVENAVDSGCSLDQCYGLTIHEPGDTWRAYTTIWEDAVAHAAEVELADVTSGKVGDADERINKKVEELAREISEADNDSGKMSGTAETDNEKTSDVETMLFSASASLTEVNLADAKIDAAQITAVEASPEENQDVSGEQLMPQDEIPVWGEAAEPQEQTADVNVYPRAESHTEMQIQPVEEQRPVEPCHPQWDTTYNGAQPATKMPFQMNRHPRPGMPMRGNMQPPASVPEASDAQPSLNDLDNTAMQRPNGVPYSINRQNRRVMQPKPGDLILDENDTESKTSVVDTSGEEMALGNPQELKRLEQEEQESSGPFKLWEGFRKQYPKIKAFDSVNGCEILTIKPQDIGLLPRENWNYGNNSFLLHGFYNYRYLILARIGDESQGRTRYILGVPGHYYSNEKYMASMFGFPHFVLSKKQPSQDGRFGYWYTDVRMENQD